MNKEIKDSCEYIDRETEFVLAEIYTLNKKLAKCHDDLHRLKELKEQLVCPEDRSLQAVKRNRALVEELKKEAYGKTEN